MTMRRLMLGFTLVACLAQATHAITLIGGATNNGYLDRTVATEIVPGFFLPKPTIWQNEGFRTNTGPYEDEMSSEPWAGPAPTPVTNGNFLNMPFPDGCGNVLLDGDCGVFFKAFSGNLAQGNLATGHLYQDHPANPGWSYSFRGWAGAEPNFSGFIPGTATRAEFALDFYDGANTLVSSNVLDLVAAGLGGNVGASFGYNVYTVNAVAPANAVTVRARASMIDGYGNPAGGGQAFVVDDFTLEAVPEPSACLLALIGAMSWLGFARRR